MSVRVEALGEGHIPAVVAGCADWQELARFGPPYWRPRSEAELRCKIAATAGPQSATEYSFVLVTDVGDVVGECSLHAIEWRCRVAQVGVAIWKPEHRGAGYGRAGVQHMIDWGSGYLGLERLEAWIVDGNTSSLRLFDRLGFEREGVLRRRYLADGVARDVHVLGLLTTA